MKLDDCPGFHDAVNEACTCGGGGPPECCPACEVYHAVKDWEVAGQATQPRPPAPELAEAERGLRSCIGPSDDRLPAKDCKVIVAELDRLRAEVARLTGEAQKTVYTGATTAENALAEAMAGGFWAEGERDSAAASCEHGEHVYEVRLTARKVEP